MNNKILIERSAYRKAGDILIHLLTQNKINDNILKYTPESDIILQEKSDSLKCNFNEVNDYKIMCLRAGPLSEKNYCWLKCINYDSGITSDDLWQISRFFYEGKSELPNFERHIKSLEEETEKFIKMHWVFIKTVAKQILAKKDLKIEETIDVWGELLFKK